MAKLKFVRGSDTSLAAAIANVPNGKTQRERVYQALLEQSATDQELQIRLGMGSSTECPRRLELVEAQSVRDSGKKRLTKSGRLAVVWEVIPTKPTQLELLTNNLENNPE